MSSSAWRRASSYRKSASVPALNHPLPAVYFASITTRSSARPPSRSISPGSVVRGFNWHHDSGLVAGPVPFARGDCRNGSNGTDTADVWSQSGSAIPGDAVLQIGSYHPRSPGKPLGTPISSSGICPGTPYGSGVVSITAQPPRTPTQPNRLARSTSSMLRRATTTSSIGTSTRWASQLIATNIANEYAFYHFISTLGGTHHLTPRTLPAGTGPVLLR